MSVNFNMLFIKYSKNKYYNTTICIYDSNTIKKDLLNVMFIFLLKILVKQNTILTSVHI